MESKENAEEMTSPKSEIKLYADCKPLILKIFLPNAFLQQESSKSFLRNVLHKTHKPKP